ncbi:arylamine N-acetyltransferase [Devosia sp.]|uniref:arylamine N-acetyltransferase family protein n=1 Tax=Devosia sp. TaxID=1871048 RepID=UPI00326517C7
MSEKVNLAAYFERIGFSGSIAPTLATLEQLHALHPAAIPFENLDAFLGLPVPLDQHSLEHKLLHNRRGGYCFEQNLLFMRVLQTLEFEVRGYAGQGLWWNPDPAGRGPSHMCLVVDIAGVSYLADVAFGSCTLTAPLKLRTEVEQTTPNDTFRLMPIGDGFRLEVKFNEVWRPAYQFELTEPTDADYAALSAEIAAKQHQAGLLIAARVQPGLRTTLRHNLLSTYRPGEERDRRILTSVEDIRAALSDTFGIALPTSDLLDPALAQMLATHTES